MKLAQILKVSTSYTATRPNGTAFQASRVTWSDGQITEEETARIEIINGVKASLSNFGPMEPKAHHYCPQCKFGVFSCQHD